MVTTFILGKPISKDTFDMALLSNSKQVIQNSATTCTLQVKGYKTLEKA